jgi:hypothetical protein
MFYNFSVPRNDPLVNAWKKCGKFSGMGYAYVAASGEMPQPIFDETGAIRC